MLGKFGVFYYMGGPKMHGWQFFDRLHGGIPPFAHVCCGHMSSCLALENSIRHFDGDLRSNIDNFSCVILNCLAATTYPTDDLMTNFFGSSPHYGREKKRDAQTNARDTTSSHFISNLFNSKPIAKMKTRTENHLKKRKNVLPILKKGSLQKQFCFANIFSFYGRKKINS